MKAFCQVKEVVRIQDKRTNEIGVYRGSRDFGAIVLVQVVRKGKSVLLSVPFDQIEELAD